MSKQRLSLVMSTSRIGDAAPLGKAGMHRIPVLVLVPAVAAFLRKSPHPRESSWRDLARRLAKKLARR